MRGGEIDEMPCYLIFYFFKFFNDFVDDVNTNWRIIKNAHFTQPLCVVIFAGVLLH